MAFMLIKNYASIQEMHQIREKKPWCLPCQLLLWVPIITTVDTDK